MVVRARQGHTPSRQETTRGRVEHLTSGQATDCGTLAEVLAFMAAVLPPPVVPPPSAAPTERKM